MLSKAEKLELLRSKLRAKANQAKKLIDRALELGEIEKANILQNHNIEVLSLLDSNYGVKKS
jgi:hypothetical protein